jgi:hypothetical protein
MADNWIMEESPLNRNTPLGVKLRQIRLLAYVETLKLYVIKDLGRINNLAYNFNEPSEIDYLVGVIGPAWESEL